MSFRLRLALGSALAVAAAVAAVAAVTYVVVGDQLRGQVEDAAFGLRQRLLHGGYPVDGDPDAVLPVFAERETASVLDLAIELLLEEDA